MRLEKLPEICKGNYLKLIVSGSLYMPWERHWLASVAECQQRKTSKQKSANTLSESHLYISGLYFLTLANPHDISTCRVFVQPEIISHAPRYYASMPVLHSGHDLIPSPRSWNGLKSESHCS